MTTKQFQELLNLYERFMKDFASYPNKAYYGMAKELRDGLITQFFSQIARNRGASDENQQS